MQIVEDAKGKLVERFTDPIMGTFIVTFFTWNWKAVLEAVGPSEGKVKRIELLIWNYSSLWGAIKTLGTYLIPIIITVILLVFYPLFKNWVLRKFVDPLKEQRTKDLAASKAESYIEVEEYLNALKVRDEEASRMRSYIQELTKINTNLGKSISAAKSTYEAAQTSLEKHDNGGSADDFRQFRGHFSVIQGYLDPTKPFENMK